MKSLYVELTCSKKAEENDNSILDKRAANVLNNVSVIQLKSRIQKKSNQIYSIKESVS